MEWNERIERSMGPLGKRIKYPSKEEERRQMKGKLKLI